MEGAPAEVHQRDSVQIYKVSTTVLFSLYSNLEWAILVIVYQPFFQTKEPCFCYLTKAECMLTREESIGWCRMQVVDASPMHSHRLILLCSGQICLKKISNLALFLLSIREKYE